MNQEALGRFIQLFTLTDAAATQHVRERLQLVLQTPDVYQERYAEELEERGMMGKLPTQELRDVALIDALLAEELLWESDWKELAPDIAEGLNEVLTQQKRDAWLRPTALAGRREPGPEQLDTVQDALEQMDLALVLFTLDSDSYPLSVVADAQAEQARELAQELGFGVTVY